MQHFGRGEGAALFLWFGEMKALAQIDAEISEHFKGTFVLDPPARNGAATGC